MHKKYKLYFFIILLPIVFLGLVVPIGFYVYDPLQIFHKHWFVPENTLNSNMRLQAAGLINNYDFDSVIIGNSILENTSAREASEVLGGKYINLSLSGSGPYERSIVLNYLLKKRKIKTIILQIDLNFNNSGHGGYPINYWSVLYDDKRFNDIKVYLEKRFLKCLATFSFSSQCVGREVDIDRPNAWKDNPGVKSRFGGIDKWITYHNHRQLSNLMHNTLSNISSLDIKSTQINSFENETSKLEFVDNYLISFVRSYKDVRFIFIVPPYSRLYYAIEARQNGLGLYFSWLRYLTKLAEKYSNLEIYAFGDRDFVDDIANYRDIYHYSEEINSFMLHAIASKDGLLTKDNIDQYIETVDQLTREYDIQAINNYVKSELIKQTGNMSKN